MADLATVDDLAAFLQSTIDPADTSAALYLSIASGMVRDYLQQDITETVGDIAYCDPLNGGFVLLEQLPVTDVSLVETFDGTTWTTQDPGNYTVSRRLGMVAGKPGCGIQWPTDPESWRITYTHGYATVPDTLKAVCLGVAGRGFSSPVAIDMERTGQRQVKYALEAGGFSSLELAALARYKVARIA